MKYYTAAALSLTLTSAALTTGCASIVSDSHYPISVTSEPTGAHFEVRNSSGLVVQSGTTPATVSLESGDGYFSGADYTVNFKKEGYDSQALTIESSIDGWYWANIGFGGLIGMLIVDPATGAMYKLPKVLNTGLNKSIASSDINNGAINIVSINSIPEEYKNSLVKISK